jgi:hypothetical protein
MKYSYKQKRWQKCKVAVLLAVLSSAGIPEETNSILLLLTAEQVTITVMF